MAERRQFLDHIETNELEKMVPCFHPLTRRYKKGEKILTYSGEGTDEREMHVAILHNGTAHLEVLDANGDVFNLETYHNGDVFGELFTLPINSNEYTVYADDACRVIYLDYNHVITPCEHSCRHHSQLISNLLIMTAQKTQELSFHLSILNQRTIRDKLLVYLKYVRTQCQVTGTAEFEIPMSLSCLAGYLCVDRSAMMRELKSMKTEGLLHSNQRKFELYI